MSQDETALSLGGCQPETRQPPERIGRKDDHRKQPDGQVSAQGKSALGCRVIGSRLLIGSSQGSEISECASRNKDHRGGQVNQKREAQKNGRAQPSDRTSAVQESGEGS